MFKEDTKKCYRHLGTKSIEAREPPSMAEVEPYWKSLWREKSQHNERAEWVRTDERRKISNIDWGHIQIMEIALFSSKAHNWKFPGNNQIQNHWLTAFPQAYYETFQWNNGGAEEGTGLAKHRNNVFATKIGRQQRSQKPPNRYVRNSHVQNPNRKNSQKNFHTSGRAELITTRAKRMSPGSKDCKDQLIISKGIHED
jgi:hypothetical protein